MRMTVFAEKNIYPTKLECNTEGLAWKWIEVPLDKTLKKSRERGLGKKCLITVDKALEDP